MSAENYCLKCEAEGKRTVLFYSVPPNKEIDTWTKRLEKKSDYRCLRHVRETQKLHGSSAGRAKHKARSENIERLHQKRVTDFSKMWNNKTITATIDSQEVPIHTLPDPDHLMWIYIKFNIRKAELGFTAREIAEVVYEDEIEYNIGKKISEWRESAKDRGLTLMIREQVEPELIREYLTIKEQMQAAHTKQLVNSVRGMFAIANMTWDKKPADQWEKAVTEPGYCDPDGNTAPRYHLLSQEKTLKKRQEKMMRKQKRLGETIEREAEIFQSVKDHTEDIGEQNAAAGIL